MAIKFNNTTIDNVTFKDAAHPSGIELCKLIYNGTLVWEEHPYSATSYAWTGCTACNASRTCSRDSSHKETATGTITSKITTAANCNTMGVRTYTATFPSSASSWTTPQTKTATDVAIDSSTHNPEGVVVKGGTAAVHSKWSCCGAVQSTTHSYTSSVQTPATCTTKGTSKYTCSCTYNYTAQDIPALGHLSANYPTVAPTCTATGLTGGTYCSTCSTTLTDRTTTAALGHNWNTPEYQWSGRASVEATRRCKRDTNHKETATSYSPSSTITTAATCTTAGVRTWTATFDKSWANTPGPTDTETIPATGHTSIVIAGKQATCTEAGLTVGSKCSVCNEILVAQDIIPATGHSMAANWITQTPASCTSAGTKKRNCTACNYYETDTIPATGHNPGLWTTGKPTCVKPGTNTSTCTVCGAEILELIPALGHNTADWEVTVQPTYDLEGIKVRKCITCGVTVQTESIPKKTDLTFELSSDGKSYAVVGANPSGQIVIPSTYNSKPVTRIGISAFEGYSALTGITIPDSVTTIEDDAFFDCDGLVNVSLGNGVTEIRDNAFDCCTSLKNITIPSSVTSLGHAAFRSCSSLQSVVIDNSIIDIGWEAFSDCSNLTSVTLGNNVRSIDDNAFYGCQKLSSIYIPRSVEYMGDYVFESCDNITITCGYMQQPDDWSSCWNDGLTVIWYDPFTYTLDSTTNTYSVSAKDTNAYGAITIPSTYNGKTVDRISSFAGCTDLTALTIPESIISIALGSFIGCSNLKTLDFKYKYWVLSALPTGGSLPTVTNTPMEITSSNISTLIAQLTMADSPYGLAKFYAPVIAAEEFAGTAVKCTISNKNVIWLSVDARAEFEYDDDQSTSRDSKTATVTQSSSVEMYFSGDGTNFDRAYLTAYFTALPNCISYVTVQGPGSDSPVTTE